MKIVAILASAFLMGCGTKNTVEVGGTATVRHVVTIEFAVCDELQEADKIECVKNLLKILEGATASKGQQQ